MQRTIRQLLVQLALATAMAIIGISAISTSAAITSAVQRKSVGASQRPATSQTLPVLPTEQGLSDRQQLRRMLLGDAPASR